jgi:gamma-D-glutamyl-L-lysine dipeptidyl-peptidase
MKNIIVNISAIILVTFMQSAAQNQETLLSHQVKIDKIKNNYAPDKRTAIFEIEAIEESDRIILKGETNLPEAKKSLLAEFGNAEVIDEVIILPEEKLGENIYGLVNLSVANMRATPRHSSELVTQALLGTPVNIYKQKGGWYLIQTPDNYLGWVDSEGIEPKNKINLNEWNSSKKIIYSEIFGLAYSEPDASSQPVSDLVYGDVLILKENKGNFVEVGYPDGRTGYIENSKIKDYDEWLAGLDFDQKNILKTAFSLMGIPYLWGGTSVKGVDCSGFTKTVFFLNGVMLPRDASQQVHVGELIDTENGFDNLIPGDLIFFGSAATDSTKERITHVGIYIGNMEFIHSAGMVKVNSLDKNAKNYSEYRRKGFIRAKRILNSLDSNGVKTVRTHLYQ